MWLEEAEELFKGYLPYYVLIVLPIFIIISPTNPVLASHEFPVYRMQHFDLHGIAHGNFTTFQVFSFVFASHLQKFQPSGKLRLCQQMFQAPEVLL